MADTKINVIDKNQLRKEIIALKQNGELDDLLNETDSTAAVVRSTPLSNARKKRNKNDPMQGVTASRFYAVAASNGYGLYRDYDKCESQVTSSDPRRLPYLRDAIVESFNTSGEAMEWIQQALADYFGITGLELEPMNYMLKWENYWFSRGEKLPGEQRNKTYDY